MDFDSIKERARKMIHDDAKKDAHIIKERVADRNNGKYFVGQPNDIYSQVTTLTETSSRPSEPSYYDDSEERLYEDMQLRTKQYAEQMKNNSNNATSMPKTMPKNVNKRLPKEILESFSENYIDESEMIGGSMASFQDGLNEAPVKEPIRETVQQQYKSSGIDYEIIKNIVEGTVKKYMGSLAKKLINENKSVESDGIKAVQFTGDKFMLVTKGGDVYEAKMVFKKNISEKK